MSADLQYNVVVNFQQNGSIKGLSQPVKNAQQDIGSLRASMHAAEASMGKIGNSVRGAFEGAVESIGSALAGVAKLGAVAGIGAVTYGVTKLNTELEMTKLSFASLFLTSGLTDDMEVGLRASSKLIEKMREDAVRLPGEFSDLKEIFQQSSSAGFAAGLSPDKLREMSGQVMAAAHAAEVPFHVAANEFAMLLSGRTTVTNRLGTRVFGLTGEKAGEFRKMDRDSQIKFMQEELAKRNAVLPHFTGTMDTQLASTKDAAKQFLEATTKPLFDRVKNVLSEFNGWFFSHRDEWHRLTDNIGATLVKAFDKVVSLAKEIGPDLGKAIHHAWEGFLVIWEKVEPLVEKVAKHIAKLAANGELGDMLKTVLSLYAASKVGGVAASVMPSPSSLMGITQMLGGGGGAAGGAGLAIGGAAMGVMAVALGEAMVGAYGFTSALTNVNSKFHDAAVKEAQAFGDELHKLKTTFGDAQMELTPLIEALGVAFVGMLRITMTEVRGLMEFIKMSADASGVTALLDAMGLGPKEKLNGFAHDAIVPGMPPPLIDPEAAGVLANGIKKGMGGGGGGVNINRVEITVASNEDPSRIARMTAKELMDIRKRVANSPPTRLKPVSSGY